MKLQAGKETDFNIIGRDGHTGYTYNSRLVQLVCLYLFEYQDAYQMNTNIRIIRIYSNNGIRMRPLVVKYVKGTFMTPVAARGRMMSNMKASTMIN